jgi:hypothetical protein
MDRYDIVCVHTIVGFAPAHAAHFSVKADGTIIQSRDTAYRSAANLEGNRRVIAIENEDHGPAFGGTPTLPGWVPLTDEQVAANARILRWAHETHGIPLQLAPNSRPDSRGLGYHRQGIDGNFNPPLFRFPGRVPGGETWTTSPGKVCPTDARIAQLPDILEQASGDDMAEYAEQLDRIEQKVTDLAADETARAKALRKSVRQQAESIRSTLRRQGATLNDVEADVDKLLELAGDE